jgi:phospholipid/cholesterol/gamma-HCH transport system substrate-binding protein
LKTRVYIVAALFCLLGAAYYLSNSGPNTVKLGCIFRNVSGLREGSNVKLAGLTVGYVDKIEIIGDSAVYVSLQITGRNRRFIRKDAIASISTDGLLGNKILTLYPGTELKSIVVDNDRIGSVNKQDNGDILSDLQSTSTNLATFTTDLAIQTNKARAGEGLTGKLLMDTSLANKLDKTLIELKQNSSKIKKEMEAMSHSILLKGPANKEPSKLPK